MFEYNESISERTGKIGLLTLGENIPRFSDIFDGSPQYYPGSMVQFQEILDIRVRVVEPKLVDVDFSWFGDKKRLGTFQILDLNGLQRTDINDSGYITSEIFKIYRYSYYTIIANPLVPFGKHEQIALDNCNAYLTAEVYLFPGDVTPDPGFRYYDRNPLFLGSSTITRAPLIDAPFNQLIAGIGLCLKPGVEGLSVGYRVAIINAINTDYDPVVPPTCEFLGRDCDAQFRAFLVANAPFVFATLAEAIASFPDAGANSSPATYVSPADPTCIRNYFIVPNF